jgi:hypothetical protein
MDFMIDEELKPWLIEINTNPCLELSCPLLSRLIPNIIEQTMRYLYSYLQNMYRSVLPSALRMVLF